MPKLTLINYDKNYDINDPEYVKMSGEEEYEQSDINCDTKMCCYMNIKMFILLSLSVVFIIIIVISRQ
jgi:hypothetical protein